MGYVWCWLRNQNNNFVLKRGASPFTAKVPDDLMGACWGDETYWRRKRRTQSAWSWAVSCRVGTSRSANLIHTVAIIISPRLALARVLPMGKLVTDLTGKIGRIVWSKARLAFLPQKAKQSFGRSALFFTALGISNPSAPGDVRYKYNLSRIVLRCWDLSIVPGLERRQRPRIDW